MNDNFQKYLEELAEVQEKKSQLHADNTRHKILVHSGVLLNWLGDFLANPDIRWEKRILPVDKILLTGVAPHLNQILIKQCERQPVKLRTLIRKNLDVKSQIDDWLAESQSGDLLILVREDQNNYKILDGMRRFVRAVIDGQTKVEVYLPTNADKILPICEPHVIYDLIRGYIRHARDNEGKEGLYQALYLLTRTYANVPTLLQERFNKEWVFEKDVQEVIKRVLIDK